MGLDMCLKAQKCVSDYGFVSAEERRQYKQALSVAGVSPEIASKDAPVAEISITVAYWRKANQIHGWFVTHCAGGKDDCKPVYVPPEKLQELRGLCVHLLKNKNEEEAYAALPPAQGFFFGGYEIGDYYWEDLELTVEQLDKALALDGYDFYYEASW